MKRADVKELHYILPITNLPSVLEHGLLSHNRANNLQSKPQTVSLKEVQARRMNKKIHGGQYLHDYVNLYFDARNPMMYKRRNLHRELCVLRISPAVLDLPDVLVSDMNAARSSASFMQLEKGLEQLDANLIYAKDWRHPGNYHMYKRHQGIKCAEVLVPGKIPPQYINGVFVSCDLSQRKVASIAPDVHVTINEELFFAPSKVGKAAFSNQASHQLEERKKHYQEIAKEKKLDRITEGYAERARLLFDNKNLRNWAFEPFADLFQSDGNITESKVRQTITGVAVANAIMAGLPGKLGVGVAVSMALEVYMALRIAQHLGLTNIKTPKDTLRFFGAIGTTAVVVIWLFKQLLGIAFSLFNTVGALPATFLAELATTNFIGVLLWAGFKELSHGKPFRIPVKAYRFVLRESRSLVRHQWKVLSTCVNSENLKLVGKRLRDWFSGKSIMGPKVLRDDMLTAAAMAALLANDLEALEGPLGKQFIRSIRDLYPALEGAKLPEMAEFFSKFDDKQMFGAINQIKGRLYERLVEERENNDGDEWKAQLHANLYHPSTDMILFNTETNEKIPVSLKATDNPAYVEHALSRYPNDPVIVTKEGAIDDPRVIPSEFRDEDLENITRVNMEGLLASIEPFPLDAVEGVSIGASLSTVATLWPFVVAWMQGKISRTQLQAAAEEVVGATGSRLVGRVVSAAALGPIYMWYALARGVIQISELAHDAATRNNG